MRGVSFRYTFLAEMNFSRNELGPDPELSPEELKVVARLTSEDIEKIDALLLQNISDKWRKLAYVVMAAMTSKDNNFEEIPDIYYAQRLRHLAKVHNFETQGQLNRMRYSEVRNRNV